MIESRVFACVESKYLHNGSEGSPSISVPGVRGVRPVFSGQGSEGSAHPRADPSDPRKKHTELEARVGQF